MHEGWVSLRIANWKGQSGNHRPRNLYPGTCDIYYYVHVILYMCKNSTPRTCIMVRIDQPDLATGP